LVITARYVLAALLCFASVDRVVADDVVRAADYDAYWLWAGVKAPADVDKARVIYLLQGEIGPAADGSTRLKAQGGATPGPHAPILWLVYRARSLDWGPEVIAAISRRLAAWRGQPGRVVGIQVDFDASTRDLRNYAGFLRRLKDALPADCALGVTGLMDWASQAEPEDLDHLSGAVDEIVFQTYRGHETVGHVDAYVRRLGRVRIPFRLGLAEGAAWSPPAGLADNLNFKGYVIFLRNRP
jgi:hypothetical protein